MAYAVEASASTARPIKKAAQGETSAARRDGAYQGNCQRSKRRVQPTPGERTDDRDLGAPCQPQRRPTRIEGRNTSGKVPGEERQGEDSRAKEPATIGQGWPSIAKVLKGGMKRDEWQEK